MKGWVIALIIFGSLMVLFLFFYYQCRFIGFSSPYGSRIGWKFCPEREFVEANLSEKNRESLFFKSDRLR